MNHCCYNPGMRARIASFAVCGMSIFLLIGCTVWGEHKPTAWTDVTGGESLERVFWKELSSKHWNELESHLAPNFVLVTPDGSFDRAGAIEHWKQLEIHDYSLGELRTELSGNTYTVTYILNIRGKINGEPIPNVPIRAMTVWQRQVREQWNEIAHSAMPVSSSIDKK